MKATQPVRERKGVFGPRMARLAPRLGLLCAFIVMLLIFDHDSSAFLGSTNVWEVLRTSAPIMIVSIGIVFPFISGQIDISVGSIVGVVGMVSFNLLTGSGWPAWAAVVIALLVACALGLVNGLLVAGVGLSSILVTLGTYTAFRGIVQVISTKSQVGVASISSNTYSWMGNGSVGPVPAPTIIAGALAIVAWFLLSYTRFGVSCRAVGGNVTSARRSGLHVGRIIIAAYMISAVASGIAAIILTSLLTTTTVTLGQGYELTAITAVVMGGVSMFGGVGDIPGALLGVLFLSFLANGFSFLNYAPQVNEIVTGAILVVAVALDQGVRRTLRKRRAWAQTDRPPKRAESLPEGATSVPVP